MDDDKNCLHREARAKTWIVGRTARGRGKSSYFDVDILVSQARIFPASRGSSRDAPPPPPGADLYYMHLPTALCHVCVIIVYFNNPLFVLCKLCIFSHRCDVNVLKNMYAF